MEKITTAVESASSFVANHFDTVEKVTVAVTGVVLAGLAAWSAKKAFAFASYCARHAYAATKSRISPPPDPVFARLLSHFDDPDAMYTPGDGKHWPKLETGGVVVEMDAETTGRLCDDVRGVTDKGYNVFPDLTPAERKTVTRRAVAKINEVIERDRLARRAALTAPKAV